MGEELKALGVFPEVTEPVGDKAERTTHAGLLFFFQELSPQSGVSLTELRLKW